MNARGQLASLDFLASLGLLTLAIGILLVHAETRQYDIQQSSARLELEQTALTSSDLLVSHPDWTCINASAPATEKIPNCIPMANLNAATITKNKLGLTKKYAYQLQVDNDAPFGNAPSPNTPFIEIRRKIVSPAAQTIALPNNTLVVREIKLRVWRTP